MNESSPYAGIVGSLRAMTGGARSRAKGDAWEVTVLKDQESQGRWCRRLRQGGGEPVDLLSLEQCRDCTENKSCSLGLGVHHVYLIQCKLGGYIAPAERAALIAEAKRIGATPLLAYRKDGAIVYKELSG